MFKGISDSSLSQLTYHLEELVCSRGQVIYTEDVDKVNCLYLVKSGEFKCTKKLPAVMATENEVLSSLLIEEANNQNISIKTIREKQSVRHFNPQIGKQKQQILDICIHQTDDQFGF
jgi:hypothetical protein